MARRQRWGCWRPVLLAALPMGAVAADAPPAKEERVEGAIGLILAYKPTYPGASDYEVAPRPAGFLRWGRITVTGAGGFTTKRKDEVDRGLGAELVRRPDFRLSLNLRYDNGRSEGDSPDLAGMGNIPRTVRARLGARWQFDPEWRLGAGISVDTLNRVGGYLVDLSVTREWPLPHDMSWHVGVGLTAAGDRYMQAWHGVTAEQSARSGLPEYRVPEGMRLRAAVATGTLRADFSPRWSGFAGIGVERMLGPAADSPLTHKKSVGTLGAGLAWRF